jgi:hypothetical protein
MTTKSAAIIAAMKGAIATRRGRPDTFAIAHKAGYAQGFDHAIYHDDPVERQWLKDGHTHGNDAAYCRGFDIGYGVGYADGLEAVAARRVAQ